MDEKLYQATELAKVALTDARQQNYPSVTDKINHIASLLGMDIGQRSDKPAPPPMQMRISGGFSHGLFLKPEQVIIKRLEAVLHILKQTEPKIKEAQRDLAEARRGIVWHTRHPQGAKPVPCIPG